MTIDYEKIRGIISSELDNKEKLYDAKFVKGTTYSKDKLKYLGYLLTLSITVVIKIIL